MYPAVEDEARGARSGDSVAPAAVEAEAGGGGPREPNTP